MRYLTAAYGAHRDRDVARVTTPDARTNLLAMRDYAPELRLTSSSPTRSRMTAGTTTDTRVPRRAGGEVRLVHDRA